MNWWLILEIVYISIVILVCLRIIYETRSTTKTLSYLLMTIFIPIFGMIFYFFVGVNYRNRKIYSKKLKIDADMDKRLRKRIMERSRQLMEYGNEALVCLLRLQQALAAAVPEFAPYARMDASDIEDCYTSIESGTDDGAPAAPTAPTDPATEADAAATAV